MLRVTLRWALLCAFVLSLASCAQQPDQQQMSTGKDVKSAGTDKYDGRNRPEEPRLTDTSLKDLIDASFLASDRARLTGKKIRVIGYFQSGDANSASLSIDIMHCCVADLIAVKIKLLSDNGTFEEQIKPREVEVRGYASFVERGDTEKWFDPIIQVPSMDCIVSTPTSDWLWINAIGKVQDPERYLKWKTNQAFRSNP
jgi:hypothetical protein